MSAPRRIWATHTETEGAIERGVWADTIRQAPEGTLYHHDDVLRELAEALEDMAGLFSADGVLQRGTHMNATLELARAALAKIAQGG